MSYISGQLIDWNNLQTKIESVWENYPDVDTMQKVPWLEYTLMPENRGLITQIVSPGKGQKRTVTVIYHTELAEDAGESNVANPICSDGSVKPPEHSQDYTIDTNVNRSRHFTFSQEDVETSFTTPDEYFARNLIKIIAALEVDISKKEAATLATLYGNWSGDAVDWATQEANVAITNDVLQLPTRKSGGIDPWPYTHRQLAQAFEYCGYRAMPMIFCGTDLHGYVLDGFTFGATDYGISLDKARAQFGFAAMFDRHVKDALGGNQYAIAVQPGATQLLTYLRNPWRDGMPYVKEGSDYVHTSIFSPRTGLPMDLLVKDNCGIITVRVIATTKLVGLPDDMFHDGNQYDGVKFVNLIQVVNP